MQAQVDHILLDAAPSDTSYSLLTLDFPLKVSNMRVGSDNRVKAPR